MEKKYEDLPEAQSSKKVNNKNQLLYIIGAVCMVIGTMGYGFINAMATLASLIIFGVVIVKLIKSRKK